MLAGGENKEQGSLNLATFYMRDGKNVWHVNLFANKRKPPIM